MRRPLSVLLAGVLTGCFVVGMSGAAQADPHAPQLTSLSLVSAPVPGGALVLDAQAADPVEQGYGIAYIHVHYELYNSDGNVVSQLDAYGYPEVVASAGNSPTGHIAVLSTLSPFATSGHYELATATAQDLTGNVRRYHRDGTIETFPNVNTTDGISPNNTLDLTAGDFDLLNPLADGRGDTGAPVLDEAELLTPSVIAGEPAAVKITARDDLAGIRALQVTYESPSGSTRFTVDTARGLAPTGLLSGLVPLGAEPGTWTPVGLLVEDNVGSRIDYSPSRLPMYIPAGIRPFDAQPDINWGGLALRVENIGPVDNDPPVLQSVSLVTPREVKAGSPVEFRYSVTDASTVRGILFTFQDVNNHTAMLTSECVTGRLVAALPLGLDPGPLVLRSVSVYDPLYQSRGYQPDGTTSSAAGTSRHDLDLTSLNMTIQPGQGSLLDDPTRVPTPYSCPGVAVVTTTAPAAALPGSLAPLTGAVTVAGQALPGATLALFRRDLHTKVVSFERLVHADAAGRFTDRVAVTSPSSWRVQFLGRLASAGRGAPAAFGPTRTVLWRRTVAVSGATRVAAGTTLTLTARVGPATGSLLVVFQRWSAGAWREVGRTRTGGSGSGLGVARLVTRPPLGKSVYRAVVPGSEDWATAGSSSFTVVKG